MIGRTHRIEERQGGPTYVAVVLKPGWLYFLRDRDFRTGQVSPYVKIGLTNFDRPVEARVYDHQTGNPREVYSMNDMQVSAVSTTENYLHHVWAPHRVHGEWFEMDDDQVAEAIKQAEDLNQLIEAHRTQIELSTTIYNQLSNGKTKKPSKDEAGLADEWLVAKKKHVLAKNTVSLFTHRLRRLMGDCRGIEGVMDFQDKLTAATLDTKSIKEKHPGIVKQYTTTKTSISGKLKPDHTNPTLKGLDEDLAKQIKDEKDLQFSSSDPDDFGKGPATRTPEIEQAHSDLLESLGEERALKIDLELIVDRVQAACEFYDGVEGLCTWKREESESEKIDWKQLAEDHPKIAQDNMTDEKRTAAFKIKSYRPY